MSYQPPNEPVPPPGGYLGDQSSGGYGQMPLPPPGDPYGPPPGYPQYGQYGYAQPQYAPSRGTNGMAIASLVCGVLGFSTCGITSILAIIFGHVALGQIRRNEEDGRGLGIAGLVLGYVAVAIGLIIILIAVIAANSGS